MPAAVLRSHGDRPISLVSAPSWDLKDTARRPSVPSFLATCGTLTRIPKVACGPRLQPLHAGAGI
ncbi:rCG53533 [Rattus norvegicus]|uniref:RCG53533 n=1 Tax=Rattus norvegicus TaxID=10116 RepID=A6J8U8_RAT|nr:rCG53533 [Rattus norvegicus]